MSTRVNRASDASAVIKHGPRTWPSRRGRAITSCHMAGRRNAIAHSLPPRVVMRWCWQVSTPHALAGYTSARSSRRRAARGGGPPPSGRGTSPPRWRYAEVGIIESREGTLNGDGEYVLADIRNEAAERGGDGLLLNIMDQQTSSFAVTRVGAFGRSGTERAYRAVCIVYDGP